VSRSFRPAIFALGFFLISLSAAVALASAPSGRADTSSVAPAAISGAPGYVSVRLRPLKGVVSVSGSDILIGSISRPGFSKIKIQFEKLKAKEEWSIFEVASDSSGGSDLGKKIATVLGRKVDIRGSGLRVDLRPSPAHVQLVVKGPRSPIQLVGFLDLESYLEGVVASEVPRDWPMEALKAQAVAARSFTLARVRERMSAASTQRSGKSVDWLLESSVIDQVFDFDRKHSRASEAVRATRGEVLTDSSRRPMKAHYHADCGGRVDLPHEVWTSAGDGSSARGSDGGVAEYGAIIDRGCAVSTRNSWRFVTTRADLSRELRRKQLVPSGFEVASLSVVTRTSGGRAEFLQARSVEGREVRFSGERLRAALGYSEIRSTLFDVVSGVAPSDSGEAARPVTVEIVGRGFGHGAGLCQWGSRQLASDGKTYREILSHYYPKSKIEQLQKSSEQNLARSN